MFKSDFSFFLFFFLLLQIARTLCLFLTPEERKCSRLCKADSSFKYDTGLFVQGLLKVATSSPSLCRAILSLIPDYCSVPDGSFDVLTASFPFSLEIVSMRYFFISFINSLFLHAVPFPFKCMPPFSFVFVCLKKIIFYFKFPTTMLKLRVSDHYTCFNFYDYRLSFQHNDHFLFTAVLQWAWRLLSVNRNSTHTHTHLPLPVSAVIRSQCCVAELLGGTREAGPGRNDYKIQLEAACSQKKRNYLLDLLTCM